MTTNLFVILLAVLASVSTLLTEAIKKFFENSKKGQASANLIALIDALVVGGGGTAASYIVLAIPFTAVNVVALIAMIFLVWIGSMIGYDKVIQLVEQITKKDN